MQEIWKPIRKFDNLFEISNYGRVRSVGGQRKILKQSVYRKTGHTYVRSSINYKKITIRTSQEVAKAFLGEKPDGTVVCHKNDIPSDNIYTNLYYGTMKQNMADRERNGHTAKSINNGRAKLDPQKVLEIRKLAGKLSSHATGRLFGVSHTVIDDVRKRKTWKHVLEEAA